MPDFQIGYPCGYVREMKDIPYVKGQKHEGKRPNSLRITGEYPEDRYKWQSNILHPYESIMVHNDVVIYLNGERVNA